MNLRTANREIVQIMGSYLYGLKLRDIKKQIQIQGQKREKQTQIKTYRPIMQPLDRYLRQYFNHNKYLGNSQRSYISQKVYNLVRYQYLLSYLIKTKPFDLDKPVEFSSKIQEQIKDKIQLLFTSQFYRAVDNPSLAKFLRVSQNKLLFRELSLSFMKDDYVLNPKTIRNNKIIYDLGNQQQAYEVSKVMNSRAPLTLRVNPLKIQKHQLVQRLQKQFKIRLMKCQFVPFGFKIVQAKQINLLETEQFEKGYFQIQDQGSQMAALRVECKPGDLILDYCGGSGGKSLAIAHLLQGKGQIFVHEPRQVALQKAKKRFARAGINNVQFHQNEQNLKKIALGKIDWVIVDAPCTGTGTLRRNPDIKLKFSEQWIKINVNMQQQIFANAVKYMSKSQNSRIVYITCSLLKQQNEEQIQKFTQLHNLEIVNKQILKVIPLKDGTDGFFAVVMKRRS